MLENSVYKTQKVFWFSESLKVDICVLYGNVKTSTILCKTCMPWLAI